MALRAAETGGTAVFHALHEITQLNVTSTWLGEGTLFDQRAYRKLNDKRIQQASTDSAAEIINTIFDIFRFYFTD